MQCSRQKSSALLKTGMRWRSSIYKGHRQRVYSICVRMTRNETDAEDLTQDAFLQVFGKIQNTPAPGKRAEAFVLLSLSDLEGHMLVSGATRNAMTCYVQLDWCSD